MGRSSGVTIPLFSIRTRNDWGIGQITALPAFAEWVLRAGQRLLQVLPTQELSDGETSPYGALSAFAIDPIYIDAERMAEYERGSIPEAEIESLRATRHVDYKAVRALKKRAFTSAFETFRTRGTFTALFAFVKKEAEWLSDHALYMALRESHDGHGWTTWPFAEKEREPEVLAVALDPHDDGGLGTRILEQMYLQWVAHEQWRGAREELRALDVQLMGDMPFIVGGESAEVWAHRDQFRTDVQLGAPPDDFSAEGQSWGLPAYDWAAMDKDDLAWLRLRASHAAEMFDRFRIDHLVGFFRQWVTKDGTDGVFVPAAEAAQKERGETVLRAIIAAAGKGTVIAEDLGVIPPFVRETMTRLGLPGYKVLPWERDSKFIPYDPKTFPVLSVATWSTHDTAPITSWWDAFEPWERELCGSLSIVGALGSPPMPWRLP